MEKESYAGMDELAIRLDLPPDEMGEVPTHIFFTDDSSNTIRRIKCESCSNEYGIFYSRIYPTKRSFEELNEQLQTRLQEQHMAKKAHDRIVLLPWSDTTRKNKSTQKS